MFVTEKINNILENDIKIFGKKFNNGRYFGGKAKHSEFMKKKQARKDGNK